MFYWAPLLKLDVEVVAGVDKLSARVKAMAGVVESHDTIGTTASK